LCALGAASLAASLAGCAPSWRVRSTFWQWWRSHLDLDAAQWDQRMQALRDLGFTEIVVQWAGQEGGEQPWVLPPDRLRTLFDTAGRLGIGLQLGLPYDERWWARLRDADDNALAGYLRQLRDRALAYAAQAAWPRHAAFRGWYIPYEIEQHSWASPARQAMLADWLAQLAGPLADGAGRPPAISTYHSRLPAPLGLAALWRGIIGRAALRPMLQDGAGVAGLGAYEPLAPLRRLLLEAGVPFDLIVELFEELPSARRDGSTFEARAADPARVRRQLRIARGYRARRVVAFAADPWLTGAGPEAQRLRTFWRDEAQ